MLSAGCMVREYPLNTQYGQPIICQQRSIDEAWKSLNRRVPQFSSFCGSHVAKGRDHRADHGTQVFVDWASLETVPAGARYTRQIAVLSMKDVRVPMMDGRLHNGGAGGIIRIDKISHSTGPPRTLSVFMEEVRSPLGYIRSSLPGRLKQRLQGQLSQRSVLNKEVNKRGMHSGYNPIHTRVLGSNLTVVSGKSESFILFYTALIRLRSGENAS
ncbi:hypothetical protein BU23DRAFT_567170 [Bimuria novae-zelandiae CBS 107.79]|uniref:Uncharacterized protein n=1 Tax=Bimuria novae-zelandiae CBS 107.79 TaxID=1447943 RepID=A0A6A5VCG3_9PLEO|nr:hypothetical protein BU23DRAFT_567170 [Bimuria novae-zelandiae CBS 107.79]